MSFKLICTILTSLVLVSFLQAEQPGQPEELAAPSEFAEIEPVPVPDFWSGGVELGIIGTDGNSQSLKLRAAADAEHKTPDHIWTNNILYGLAEADSIRAENRFIWKSKYEWLFVDSPWSLFIRDEVELDEFKAFDARVSGHAGVGYLLWKDESTELRTRAGAGASREIGGPENRIMPEALFGFDFCHNLSEVQKITASADIFPDLAEFGEFRAEAKAAYEILIDPAWGLTFKTGVLDRYDSTPEGRRANDLEFFLTLLWKF